MHDQGELRGKGIVSTVMSNLGLERYLKNIGLTLERADVGDRYVIEKMRAGNYNVGGEQSGHIILLDRSRTGDGTIAALKILSHLVRTGKPASEILNLFQPVPQILKNESFKGETPLKKNNVRSLIAGAEKELSGNGRLLVRESGTEPVIRVMAEGDSTKEIEDTVDRICEALEGQ